MKNLLILTAFLSCFVFYAFKPAKHSFPSFDRTVLDSFPNTVKTSNDSTRNYLRGVIQAGQGYLNTNYIDTASANLSPIRTYSGAQIWVNDTLWVRDITAVKWIAIQAGNGGIALPDTIFTELPIYVDTTILPGERTIALQQQDGLISGGIVTWAGKGLIFNITAATYRLNGNYYLSPAKSDTLSPADLTYSRIDLFIVDTTGKAGHLTGLPAPAPTVPQVDAISQIALTSGITINVGDTIPNQAQVQLKTIYDENLGTPSEWTYSTSGTTTTNANSISNPYHLTKAIYVSKYNNGSKLNFLSASIDTVSNGDILKGWVYFNGAFTNSFKFQLFNGTTAVSNSLTIKNTFGLNPNDSNQYQLFAIPLSAFTFTSQYYNKLVITHVGNDNSGAKGYYLDYLQIQRGIIPVAPPTDYSNKQDSNHVSNDSLFWCVKGVCHFVGMLGGGGTADRFGIEDNTGIQNRLITLGTGHGLNIRLDSSGNNYFKLGYPMNGNNKSLDILFETLNSPASNTYAEYQQDTTGFFSVFNTNDGQYSFNISPTDIDIQTLEEVNNTTDGTARTLSVKPRSTTITKQGGINDNTPHEIVTAVNGNFADSTGNVNISAGAADRFGIEDSTGIQNRVVDMQQYGLQLGSIGNFHVYNNGAGIGNFDVAYGDGYNYVNRTAELFLNDRVGYIYAQGNSGNDRTLSVDSGSVAIQRHGSGQDGLVHEIATSVNGNFADNTGNITISTVDATSWHINGNSGITTSNFLGPTTNTPLLFQIGGTNAGYLSSSTSMGIGYDTYPYATGAAYSFSKNLAVGPSSLRSLGTPSNLVNESNIAIGYNVMGNMSNGYSNLGIGPYALAAAGAGSGGNATFRSLLAVGSQTLFSLTAGIGDMAIGDSSFRALTSGNYNIGLGPKTAWNKTSLTSTTGFTSNVLYVTDSVYHMHMLLDSAAGTAPNWIGKDGAGNWHVYANTAGATPNLQAVTNVGNVTTKSIYADSLVGTSDGKINGFTLGRGAGNSITNTVFGLSSLHVNTSGQGISAFGNAALYSNTTGSYNSAFGNSALIFNTTGQQNSAFGESSLYNNVSGLANTGIGDQALYNTTGSDNTGVGFSALFSNTTGTLNSALGFQSFYNNTNFTNSTAIGANSQPDASNEVMLGDGNVTQVKTSGFILSKYKVLTADPTTTDLPAGFTGVFRNSTSGNTYLWANIAGTLIKVQLL